jgi:hypothetical protein
MGIVTRSVRALLLSRVRVVMIAVGSLAVLLVGASHLLDAGEIVKLVSVDAIGREHVTQLWVVDFANGSYLRADSPDAGWLARLRGDPEVTLKRGDGEAQFRAVCEEGRLIRGQVNRAMSEKYGFADRLWGRFSDHARAVPVRLVPSRAEIATAP